MRFVGTGVAEDVADTAKDRVALGAGFDHSARGAAPVGTPVADPVFSEDCTAEIIKRFVTARAVGGETKGMGAGAEGDDGNATGDGGGEARHGGVWPLPKTKAEDDPVGGIEGLGVGDALVVVGINCAVGIEREEDRAAEAVTLTENFREHWQAFLGTILLVAREEHEVATGTRAVGGGRVGDRGGGGMQGWKESAGADEQAGEDTGQFHGWGRLKARRGGRGADGNTTLGNRRFLRCPSSNARIARCNRRPRGRRDRARATGDESRRSVRGWSRVRRKVSCACRRLAPARGRS